MLREAKSYGKKIKIWYDKEGDYSEILFDRRSGYFRETKNDAVLEKVDAQGKIFGISILKVSSLKKQKPLSISLKERAA